MTETKDRGSFTSRFFRRNLEAANERGDEIQKNDMAGVVSQTSQVLGELGDLLGGRRSQRKHKHHPVDDLVNAAVNGVKEITKLRREIDKG